MSGVRLVAASLLEPVGPRGEQWSVDSAMPDLGQSFALRVRQIEVAGPTGMAAVAKLDHAQLAVRLVRAQPLLDAAQPHLACLSAVGEGPHVLYVADPEAYVLRVEGDTV